MILTFKIGSKQTQVEHLGMGVVWARFSGEGEDAVTPLTARKLHVLTGPDNRLHVLTGGNQTHKITV